LFRNITTSDASELYDAVRGALLWLGGGRCLSPFSFGGSGVLFCDEHYFSNTPNHLLPPTMIHWFVPDDSCANTLNRHRCSRLFSGRVSRWELVEHRLIDDLLALHWRRENGDNLGDNNLLFSCSECHLWSLWQSGMGLELHLNLTCLREVTFHHTKLWLKIEQRPFPIFLFIYWFVSTVYSW